jgi:glutamine---fructose-6-phosphate transaminase (isomerizing)
MEEPPVTAPTSHTRTEILGQSADLAGTLAQLASTTIDLSAPHTRLVFTGCGSSLHLAEFAAAHARRANGALAWAVPASEVWLEPATALIDDAVVIAISRSGSTTEAVRAARTARARGHHVIGLTLEAHAPLVEASDESVVLADLVERSIVMTTSFSCLLVVLQHLLDGPSRRAEQRSLATAVTQLPGLLPGFAATAADLVAAAPSLYVMRGAGPASALAREAALKMREMTQHPVAAFQTLEFRHGPLSVVEEGVTVISLRGARDDEVLDGVGEDVLHRGGTFVNVAPAPRALEGGVAVALPPELSEGAYAVLSLPFIQLLALHQAEALGLNPDEPRHLGRVVTLEETEG